MPHGGRKKADQTLQTALACGATVENAARTAGVSPATVYRRLKDTEFQKKLQEIRSDMVRRTAGGLTAAGMEFVKTLLELSKPPAPYPVRLGAARAGLEIGAKLRESADLEQRVVELEERLNAKQSS
jgi:AcrR family transcriptional regulator